MDKYSILDIDYFVENNNAIVRVYTKDSSNRFKVFYDDSFLPYLYFKPNESINEEMIEKLAIIDNEGSIIKPLKIERSIKELFGKQLNLFKIYYRLPSEIKDAAEHLKNFGECFEYDISFYKRYLIDNQIVPFRFYEIDYYDKDNRSFIRAMKPLDEYIDINNLNVMAFDIEVYNPNLKPNPKRDPIIMISYCIFNGSHISETKVLTTKQIGLENVILFDSEAEMIKAFIDIVKQNDIDIITGYNSSTFDIDYLKRRSAIYSIDFDLSRVNESSYTKIESHGLNYKVVIAGRIHIDMYTVSKFVALVGASANILKLADYTLRSVYEALTNDKKVMVNKAEIYKMWDGSADQLKELAEYNLNDSYALYKVFTSFFPLIVEISKITGSLIKDTAVSTAGQLVESTLQFYSKEFNAIIPEKPEEKEIIFRELNPIQGAFVKTPDPGLYNNLAILDFRGLYPSIIIAHNIDPSCICDSSCSEYYEAPNGIRFRKDKIGEIPTVLKRFVDERALVKKLFKQHPDDIILGSRSQALKIIANSFYGYLGYSRSRWYSRECASAVTAYGRYYIMKTIEEAEKAGFKVIYSDTDSIVILLGSKGKDDVISFMKDYNSKLPKDMELELEDFYMRGIFVGKKTENQTTGAKKKYALITYDGKIKVKGFELVRRDWSKIARDTQMNVIETILRYGDINKAVSIVKETINRLRSGAVPLEDLAISTQLRKSIDSYDVRSPELNAALDAIKKGFKTKNDLEGSVIKYVITKEGSNPSEKAKLLELAKDYDANYYIEHQILPAVMRIFKEFNISKDSILNSGMQRRLI
ncbi:MAG: DNA polymerase [Candidatus Micrarchaeota archaeon]|nr:MAG: DNA polymerase [Candidatus Micrarchaeota archaeon]